MGSQPAASAAKTFAALGFWRTARAGAQVIQGDTFARFGSHHIQWTVTPSPQW